MSMLTSDGVQVLIATHSPIIAALSGATLLELDKDNYHECAWDELELVAHYRSFCDSPGRHLPL